MVEVKNCPVCGASSFKEVFKAPHFRGEGELFSIKECEGCNFWVTSPRPADEDLGAYYQSSDYISHSNSSKTIMDRVYKWVRNYSLKKKVELIESIDNGKRHLLDYGAGTGHFLKEAQKSGWDVQGIEVSEDARKVADEENGLKLYGPDEYNILNKSFSVITLWHVLEHLPDLNEHLKKFYNALSDGGKLVIAVPNHESYDSKAYGRRWAALDVPLHLWHFKKSSIELIGRKHGLNLVDIKNMPFDSFYVSLLSEKIESDAGNPLRAIMRGLKSNMKGKSDKNMSSLIYILEKS